MTQARASIGLLALALLLVPIGPRAAEAGGQPPDLAGAQSPTAAMARLADGSCRSTASCDLATGCIAPTPALEQSMTEGGLGTPERARLAARQFQACRTAVLGLLQQQQLALAGQSPSDEIEWAKALLAANQDIFWAPASKASGTEPITQFGDEARAVFGPLPPMDCSATALVTHLEVDGNVVRLKPNKGKPGQPLEFEHRDAFGQVVKWTTGIRRCDKPTLAGGWKDTWCSFDNRFSRVVRGNVEWVSLCRKADGADISATPFWTEDNLDFTLIGMYGFNMVTGESVFFDGRKDRASFDGSRPFVQPGGTSYGDDAGRAAAEALYDGTFNVQCSQCHDNKNLHVVDPEIHLKRVGYRDPTIRDAFGIPDNFLPRILPGQDAPFRVVGSGYTATYKSPLSAALTLHDPAGCTQCHTLTTQRSGKRFAADAVARVPDANDDLDSSKYLDFLGEYYANADALAHRTDWVLSSGGGQIHPWMVLPSGPKLDVQHREISPAEWRVLSNCIWSNGGSECGYKPLYTQCPAPESMTPNGDPAAIAGLAASVVDLSSGGSANAVRVSWQYRNALGEVPERDDVRFNVAVKESDIPAGGGDPVPSDFPSLAEAEGAGWQSVQGDIGRSGTDWVLQNASYAGHLRWTDPLPTATARDYRVDIPAQCGKRYLIRIAPKRFCFDNSGQLFSSADHTLYADVGCP
jgi:hypothetical protein